MRLIIDDMEDPDDEQINYVTHEELSMISKIFYIVIGLDGQRRLTPHEAVNPHTCPSCNGTGAVLVDNRAWIQCMNCKGTGQV